MNRPVVIVRHELGPRMYVGRRRVHHGTWALLMAPFVLWLAWVDRKDWRQWFLNEMMK